MFIIDGTYLIYKSFYRAKKIEKMYDVADEKHFQKIARNMFLRNLSKLKNRFEPSHLFIVFDCEGTNFRHKLLPTYKSNRKDKPEELYDVKTEIYHFLQLHNFSFQIADGVEADDLIASYVHQHPEEEITVYTGDADMGAVVRKNVTLLLEKNKKIRTVTEENFHHFFDVPPSRVADFKALQGDKSDFVKGVDGLFRTEAIHLLIEYPSVEAYVETGMDHYLYPKIDQVKDKLLINKQVTTMKTDCTIDVKKEETALTNTHIPEKIAKKIGWI